MTLKSDEFLSHFNRIEKWLQNELDNPKNMGFSEMVRRLTKQKHPLVGAFSEDLLQFAQLRNAIIHERISEDFVIAEPNEWAVDRIQFIEHKLTQPEMVLPRFAKRVTGFERTLPLADLLQTIAEKRYSQFPLYNKGTFEGLITLRGIGYWFAVESQKGPIDIGSKKAEDLLLSDGKLVNYAFVASDTFVFQIEEMFHTQTTLEAILITKDGNPNGNLQGIIRPRDIYQREKD